VLFRSWKVIANLPTGKNPGRVKLQADGAYLWVAFGGSGGAVAGEGAEARSGVSVFDARTQAKVAEIETGKGGHDLALSDDSRYAFVTNEGDDTVSVIDVAGLRVARTIATGDRPVSVAWSKLAGAAYVVATGDGAITVVDPASARPPARAQANAGSGPIRFAPDERFGFIVNTSKDEVHILDASLNQVVQTADVEDEPDQIAFSGELAYVRHRATDAVFMIPWKQVGQRGKPIPAVDFTGGQTPPGRMAVPSPADGIVQAPGAAAVLVANYGDQIIYYYKEGMAAPMGSFKNYGKSPRALLVVDRTLRQVRPGVYETNAKMTGDGRYDLVLFLDAPRQVQCFPIQVAENPVLAAARRPKLKVDSSETPERMRAGAETIVRVRLTDAETGAPLVGLKDVRFLTFRSPGLEQRRQAATELGDGRYEVRYTPSEAGLYYVFLEVPSKGMSLQKSPYVPMMAEPAEAEAVAAAGGAR
jgi:YVTN family beta-propeller protein